MQVGASIEGLFDYFFVDGNKEDDPESRILDLIENSGVKYFGVTVMPGPQLKQAIPISKAVREKFPDV
ncbi:MAG: radical SAM protein, partial [Flavobacteriales bacterium]|nr:radical SAM protein [Flavobacteriales bacterium]